MSFSTELIAPDGETRAVPRRGRHHMAALLAAAAVLLGLALLSRLSSSPAYALTSPPLNLATVSLVHARPAAAEMDLVLPANVRAAIDTPIYARTNGYLKRWLVDIGTPVKAGQLMAEIDTPEIDDSLRKARAAEALAQADYDLARVTADRWSELAKTNAVAHQDVDQKLADLAARRAALDGARAEMARLQQLESFKHVVAPFAGVVTARRVDVGALISAGSSGPVTELFHLAQSDHLRVTVDIPQAYAALATVGQPASIEMAGRPDAALTGKISRTAEAIDPIARTLLVEIDLDNPKGSLLAGSYAQVSFRFTDPHPALSLPDTTLLFRPDGPAVAVVDAAGRVTLTPLVLGRNDGRSVQVLHGITPEQAIANDPPDSLVNGERVQVAAGTKEL